MNTRVKSAAIMLALIITISVFTSLAATTTATAATTTTTKITASNRYPAVNQKVTLIATLKSGTTPLSDKSVTIYHYQNGVKSIDTKKTTNSKGQITFIKSFSTAGQRTYYASFAGNSQYVKSTSSVVNINVGSTKLSLSYSGYNTFKPYVYQNFTLSGTLKSGTTPLSGKSVTIYHYQNGVKSIDTTKKTNSKGQFTFTKAFYSAGLRTYYASFAGSSQYMKSKSGPVYVIVIKIDTRVALTASDTTPAMYQKVTFTAKLEYWNDTAWQWEPLSGKKITITHYDNGINYPDGYNYTNRSGIMTFERHFTIKGDNNQYKVDFQGDSRYLYSFSNKVTITVH